MAHTQYIHSSKTLNDFPHKRDANAGGEQDTQLPDQRLRVAQRVGLALTHGVGGRRATGRYVSRWRILSDLAIPLGV